MEPSTRLPRRALIVIGERVYLSEDAFYDGQAVTFTGRLRVRDSHGERLYEPKHLTIAVTKVDRIEWLS